MNLEHELIKKQKRRKSSSRISVELYPLATELFNELEGCGIIQRMKDIPQLGVIRVSEKLKKSRYDYIVLQLYFHQLIRKQKSLQTALTYTYGNTIQASEFKEEMEYSDSKCKPTVCDMIQLLTISYNIGHFYNTFVASRAAIMFASINDGFKRSIVEASAERRYQNVAERMLTDMNYQRYHLLNALLILQRCDQNKISVQLAQELIYAYINENSLHSKSKLHYVFELYRSVRNVAYISYDLQIAKTPLTIDLRDPDSLLVLFRELLSTYNDNRSTKNLVYSMSKLLDDTVYNEESNAICYYMISNVITKKLGVFKNWDEKDYYSLWENKDSVFNCRYLQHRDYIQKGILKLTFKEEHKSISRSLFSELSHTNGVRAGYYDRNRGEQTILVSLKRSCEKKIQIAFRVLRIVIKALRGISDIKNNDPRYLLATKFFLFYLADENPIVIKPTIHPETCVICTKGKKQRINTIQNAIQSYVGNKDEIHEADNLCRVLQSDSKNDVCISLPSSILVYNKEEQGKILCEFDGMIIFPNRRCGQLVFLEAKNTKEKPSYGKKCLIKKLRKLKVSFDERNIQIKGKDAVLYYDI
ncbi:hypothetical protein [Anaerotignum sp.]